MKKEKKSREEIIEEWLSLYPKSVLESEKIDAGQTVVLVPHPENWFTKKFLPKPKSPAAKIKSPTLEVAHSPLNSTRLSNFSATILGLGNSRSLGKRIYPSCDKNISSRNCNWSIHQALNPQNIA